MSMEWKAGLVGHKIPNPTIDVKEAAKIPAFLICSSLKSFGPVSSTTSFLAFGAASSIGGFGLGQSISPFSVIIAPLATSSSKFVVVAPSLHKIYCMNLEILFA